MNQSNTPRTSTEPALSGRHLGRRPLDLTGRAFGRLIAVERVEKRGADGSVVWKCVCMCKRIHLARAANLVSGRTRSCGCLRTETASRQMRTRALNLKTLVTRIDRLERLIEELRLSLSMRAA